MKAYSAREISKAAKKNAPLPEIPNHILAQVLLDDPVLWDATIFGQEVPDFHSHLWLFLDDDTIKNLVIELPGGHAKSALISGKYPIRRLCKDPNDRICIMQKGIEQARTVVGAIQRELQHNRRLNELYGPFKPDAKLGYPWSTTTFRIAGNTDRGEQTNSVHAYGWSSTDIMGNRFKAFLGDDFVTEDNSDTPDKRLRISNKETTEWDKTLIGAPNPRYILMGTPMFFEDAFESKLKLASDYLGPEDWRTPDEVDKSGLVFIRRSAEKPHPKRKGQTLWPMQADWPFLEEEKRKGYVNYKRRLCCEVSDSAMAVFRPEAIHGGFDEETKTHYVGCKDYDRKIGDVPPGLRVVCGVDPSSGSDTKASAQFAHITIAYDRVNDTIYIIDFFSGKISPIHASDKYSPIDGVSQMGTIVSRHHKYGAQKTVIEYNAQQTAWIDMVKVTDRTVNTHKHHTGKNKHDKKIGVDSMAGYFETGHVRIPYGDPQTQKVMDELITQLVRYPFGDYTDGVMALWFAVFYVRKKGQSKIFDYDAFKRSAVPLIGRKTA